MWFAVVLISAVLFGGSNAQTLDQRNGIINATLVDSLRQFPHHVSIHVRQPSYNQYCSGSILTHQWILTAATCAMGGSQLELMFNRLNINVSLPVYNETKAYSVVIDADGNVYSNDRVNLALIRLPTALQFDTNVAPIAFASEQQQQSASPLAVMAGVRQGTLRLGYGEFEILQPAACSAVYPWFESDKEVCTNGWRNSTTVPCSGTQGGGLLMDWPSAPKLVGVFSAPQSCLSYIPAEYVRVSSFVNWIEGIVGKRMKNTGYFE